jgi:8-oxo-dGTP pyrophosphatase MutT (NUDIX family)
VTQSLQSILEHADLTRLAAALRERPGRMLPSEGNERYAAVAAVFRAGADAHPELLMIKRAEHESDPWSGHIALPGGRMEPGDRDLEQTAVRETWEETGIDIARAGYVLGRLDDLGPRTPVLPPLVIRPFVAVVPANTTIVANPEVADAFWVPLSALRERAAWGLSMVDIRGVGTREVETFRHGGYTVWGLTERILRDLLSRLEGLEKSTGNMNIR